MKITIYGAPRTKKNSSQIVKLRGHYCVIPSKAYKDYEKDALRQVKPLREPIGTKVNVKCLYYMPTRRRVDLCNLLEATCDILVKGKVLMDDNSSVVVGHDGSRVLYDKDNPRVVVYVEAMDEA